MLADELSITLLLTLLPLHVCFQGPVSNVFHASFLYTRYASSWLGSFSTATLNDRHYQRHGNGNECLILHVFLPHEAMHSADYAVVRCLSVRPSVTFVYCIETSYRWRSHYYW